MVAKRQAHRLSGWTRHRRDDGGSNAKPVHVAESAVVFYDHFWSPDSKQIAFIREVKNDKEIYLVNADGSGERRLTSNLDNNAQSDLQWSSDGERILYVCGKNDIFNTDICSIERDGSDQVQLTTNPLLDIEPVWRP